MIVSTDNENDHPKKRIYNYRIEWSKAPINIYTSLSLSCGAKKINMEQKYYYGNAISEYGLENGRVDYATLAKAFDAVLSNDIMSLTYNIGYWDQISGTIDNTDEIEELEEKRDELEEQNEKSPSQILENEINENKRTNRRARKRARQRTGSFSVVYR